MLIYTAQCYKRFLDLERVDTIYELDRALDKFAKDSQSRIIETKFTDRLQDSGSVHQYRKHRPRPGSSGSGIGNNQRLREFGKALNLRKEENQRTFGKTVTRSP